MNAQNMFISGKESLFIEIPSCGPPAHVSHHDITGISNMQYPERTELVIISTWMGPCEMLYQTPKNEGLSHLISVPAPIFGLP